MFRIDGQNVSSTLPTPGVSGIIAGYFKAPIAGVSGTQVTHDWLNAVQEEISYVITESGGYLNKYYRTQLYDGIVRLIDNKVIDTTVTYYLSATGSDTTGDGSIGNPWRTPTKVYAELSETIIGSNGRVTISMAAGTYAITADQDIDHNQSDRIFIVGAGNTTILDVSSNIEFNVEDGNTLNLALVQFNASSTPVIKANAGIVNLTTIKIIDAVQAITAINNSSVITSAIEVVTATSITALFSLDDSRWIGTGTYTITGGSLFDLTNSNVVLGGTITATDMSIFLIAQNSDIILKNTCTLTLSTQVINCITIVNSTMRAAALTINGNSGNSNIGLLVNASRFYINSTGGLYIDNCATGIYAYNGAYIIFTEDTDINNCTTGVYVSLGSQLIQDQNKMSIDNCSLYGIQSQYSSNIMIRSTIANITNCGSGVNASQNSHNIISVSATVSGNLTDASPVFGTGDTIVYGNKISYNHKV